MLKDALKKVCDLWEEIFRISVTTHASSISYFTFLSLVPILSICISLLSAVGLTEPDVVSFLASITPEALSGGVEALVADAFASSGLAFSLSTLALIWSASKGARAFRIGLNAAYTQEETRGTVTVSVISVMTGLITDIVLTVTIYLIFRGRALHLIATFVPILRRPDVFAAILITLATMGTGVIWLTACYTHLTAGKRSFTAQLPGAVCAILACGILSFGFRLYVDNFSNYTMLYGSIATVALLLLWMYMVSYVLILGGIINRLIARERSDT